MKVGIGEKMTVTATRTADPAKLDKGVDVSATETVLHTEDRQRNIPEDQVGQCDNLTASYWG
ncbi:MAG: hypothetical protein WCX84_07735 [Syntrophales bacterium]|jgi:hypothetical protein|nr:hypothetical protein [Syntrophales bacterium]NLN60613.1 hypothetical protein [Deltaproteobacteria bacterium]